MKQFVLCDNLSIMGTINKPDIITQTIIINDDYIRKNRLADGSLEVKFGSADIDAKRILINRYVIDDNITMISPDKVQELKDKLSKIDEQSIIAHEAQHIHNGAIGYGYLANSDNIYESMMLSFADEMSAMLAGYMNKHKNVDDALADVFKNLSGDTRQKYITGQFQNHFNSLQKMYGNRKNLYEHKFDSRKINKILDYYFTINGVNVMNNMSKDSKIKFGQFMVEVKSDIKKHIDNQILMSMKNQKNI
ncbi:MAG: hemophore-related protein [Alphaproteobacteria bacterium]|nr:hemophore-related protein [Alphaproteobacteria bacterium]